MSARWIGLFYADGMPVITMPQRVMVDTSEFVAAPGATATLQRPIEFKLLENPRGKIAHIAIFKGEADTTTLEYGEFKPYDENALEYGAIIRLGQVTLPEQHVDIIDHS